MNKEPIPRLQGVFLRELASVCEGYLINTSGKGAACRPVAEAGTHTSESPLGSQAQNGQDKSDPRSIAPA